MGGVEEFIKMLGAVHKTSPFGYMFVTPEEARNALARMGMITPPSGKFGLDTSEIDDSFGLFTGLNEGGELYKGLEGETDGTAANLSDIYETMDLRGVAGHYFLKPLARAIEGFNNGKKRGEDRAEKIIDEAHKKIFGEEKMLEKPKQPYIMSPYHAYLGGRPAAPSHIVPYSQAYLGRVSGPYRAYREVNSKETRTTYNPSDFAKNPYLANTLSEETSIVVNPLPNLEEIRNYFERGG